MMLEGLVVTCSTGEKLRVREVWADNLEDEMAIIEEIVEDYPFLAMDTEFPGAHACWSVEHTITRTGRHSSASSARAQLVL